jgi:hypothetical protein
MTAAEKVTPKPTELEIWASEIRAKTANVYMAISATGKDSHITLADEADCWRMTRSQEGDSPTSYVETIAIAIKYRTKERAIDVSQRQSVQGILTKTESASVFVKPFGDKGPQSKNQIYQLLTIMYEASDVSRTEPEPRTYVELLFKYGKLVDGFEHTGFIPDAHVISILVQEDKFRIPMVSSKVMDNVSRVLSSFADHTGEFVAVPPIRSRTSV